METRQATIKRAHPKTCEWMLNQPEYVDWLISPKLAYHNGILWIRAKPGAGKSTLMKFLLDHFRGTRTDCHTIAFFFNVRGQLLEKSTLGTYRSLLWQTLNIPGLQHLVDAVAHTMISEDNQKLLRP